MTLEGLKLEASGDGHKIDSKIVQDKLAQITYMQTHIENITKSKDSKIADRLRNSRLKVEIMSFVEDAANNRLGENLSNYNASKFDKNGIQGLDSYEFEQFSNSLNTAIEQIIMFDGVNKFHTIHQESHEPSLEKKVANFMNLGHHVLGNKGGTSFAEVLLQRLGLTEEQLKIMGEKKFDITSPDSIKELSILLSKDLGDGLEDFIRLLANIPSALILIPRYSIYRAYKFSDNPQKVAEGEIKIHELIEENPALVILEILGEKGLEMIKQLGSMMTSGKQADIATLIVSIAGLIAGGAGAVKLGARFSRLRLINNARLVGKEARITSKISGTARKIIGKVEKGARAVESKATKLNDTIMLAGLNKVIPMVGKLSLEKFSLAEKRKVFQTIVQNFPLCEIMRLIPGEKIININLTGIKQINDIAGQAFTDKISARFRNILKENFSKSTGRIVKDDYKNMAFVTTAKDPLVAIFGNYANKTEIIEQIIVSLKGEIEANARLMAEGLRKEGIIKNQAQFDEFVRTKIIDTDNIVRKHFNFGVGSSEVPMGATDMNKLSCIRQAEISSRPRLHGGDIIELRQYNHREIIANLRATEELENNIIEKFNGKQFTYNGTQYNAVFSIGGERRISTELLRYVRKYPEKIIPQELSNIIQEYIASLNNSLDFISPIRGELSATSGDFALAKTINEQFRTGALDTKYLTHNFKGGMSKEAFFRATHSKVGTRFFIDIKDMGIENINDFSLLKKKILAVQKKFDLKQIDEITMKTAQDKLFLEAGKSVTDKFIKAEYKIKELYPKATLCFGGDEIYIFIGGNVESAKISDTISRIFASTGQKARITVDKGSNMVKSNKSFSKLDETSGVNKAIEEVVEKQKLLKGISPDASPVNTTLTLFSKKARRIFFGPNFDLENFTTKFKKMLASVDLTKLDANGIELGEIQSGVKVKIKPIPNGGIEIYSY